MDMKSRLKILIMAVVASLSLTGCVKLWEDEQVDITHLPGTEIPLTPEPWEPEDIQEDNAGCGYDNRNMPEPETVRLQSDSQTREPGDTREGAADE
jgi:hypothetical protein